MTKRDAQRIAVEYLKAKQAQAGSELVLLSAKTIERSFGWVFFYDSKLHVETGDLRYALAGNAPIVITRADGRIHETGTAHPLEHYLANFEK
jgi:hypothetical protein